MIRHLVVLAVMAVLFAAVFLLDTRLGKPSKERPTPQRHVIQYGCLVLLGALVYGFVSFGILGAVAFAVLLCVAGAGMVAAAERLAPSQFPTPAGAAATEPEPVRVADAALGRPAPAFERVGTWLSSRGNCRNTAWSPAPGPRQPRLAWRYRVPPGPRSYSDYVNGAPAVATSGDVYLATGHGLAALSADGVERWFLETEHLCAAPALDLGGRVVGSSTRGLVVVAPAGDATWREYAGATLGAATVAEDGTIVLAGGSVTAFHADGTRKWSAKGLPRMRYPPAVSPRGDVYVTSHDTQVWNQEDPSSGYDLFQALSPAGGELERVEANDEGYGSVWGGDTAAMCLEDGTPVAGCGERGDPRRLRPPRAARLRAHGAGPPGNVVRPDRRALPRRGGPYGGRGAVAGRSDERRAAHRRRRAADLLRRLGHGPRAGAGRLEAVDLGGARRPAGACGLAAGLGDWAWAVRST